MAQTEEKQELAIVSRTHVENINDFYKQFSLQCQELKDELATIHQVDSLPTFNVVQERCKAANGKLQGLIEKRKQISRILDLGKDRLMIPEKSVETEIKRVRTALDSFYRIHQENERRERVRREQERKDLEEVIRLTTQVKICLEAIWAEVRFALVDRIPAFLRRNQVEKTYTLLTSVEQLGQFETRYQGVIRSALAGVHPDKVKRIQDFLATDEQYAYQGFLARINHNLQELLIELLGDDQDAFYSWSEDKDMVSIDKALDALKENLIRLVPEYAKAQAVLQSDLSVAPPQGPTPIVNQAVVASLEGKAQIEILKANLQEKAVISDETTRGIAVRTVTVLDSKEAIHQLIAFYLEDQGSEGYNRLLKSIDFILTYAAKKQPVLPGIRYLQEDKVTLR